MNSMDDFPDPRNDAGRRELAQLLAAGFLRLSKTPEWRERAADEGSCVLAGAGRTGLPSVVGRAVKKPRN